MNTQLISKVREFNRYYTGVIGLLDRHVLESQFSLPEARVLYELYHHQPCTASDLIELLGIDKGYLSRILLLFSKKGLLQKKKRNDDGRASDISLTPKGNQEFKKIDHTSAEQIRSLLQKIKPVRQQELLGHMNAIRKIIDAPAS